MGVAERRQREKQELRQEILSAARELFIKEGYANVSMRRIADRIEYSPTTIYLYFQDKGGLLDAIVEERLQELLTQFDDMDHSAAAKDPVSDLKRGLRTYVDYWVAHPLDFRVTYMTNLAELDPTREWKCQSLSRELFAILRRSVEACVRADGLPGVDIDLASQSIWAACYGVICLLVTKTQFQWADRDQLIQTVINSAVEGIRTPHLAMA